VKFETNYPFQNGCRPPSCNCFTHARPPTKSLLLAAAACQISCQSDTQMTDLKI